MALNGGVGRGKSGGLKHNVAALTCLLGSPGVGEELKLARSDMLASHVGAPAKGARVSLHNAA